MKLKAANDARICAETEVKESLITISKLRHDLQQERLSAVQSLSDSQSASVELDIRLKSAVEARVKAEAEAQEYQSQIADLSQKTRETIAQLRADLMQVRPTLTLT